MWRLAVWMLVLACGLAARAAERDPARMAAMDAHALAAPPAVTTSVAALAAYLARPARTDAEKARAIFRWVTENIDYNAPALVHGGASATRADDVLRARTSVCAGYANLFEALARAAGLEVATIDGFAKGYGYAVGDRVEDRPNHSWNAVRLDGAWQLLDPTWGAGHLGDDMRYRRAFNPHYFCTPPVQMAVDHFPLDPRWQLLDPPVTREVFARYVLVRPTFFLLGLGLDSHPGGQIAARERLRVTVTARENVEVLGELRRDDRQLDAALTFAQREGDRQAVYVVFPAAGAYTLRLFARKAGDDGPFAWALDYQVRAEAGAGAQAGFPTLYGAFTQAGARLAAPLEHRLAAGTAAAFDLTVPGAQEVVVQTGGATHWLTRQGDRFTGTVTIRPGEVLVAAKFLGKPGFAVLIACSGV